MKLLHLEPHETKENADTVGAAFLAREDDAARVKGAGAEGEEDGFSVGLVLLADAHELLLQRRCHKVCVK